MQQHTKAALGAAFERGWDADDDAAREPDERGAAGRAELEYNEAAAAHARAEFDAHIDRHGYEAYTMPSHSHGRRPSGNGRRPPKLLR